MNRNTFRKRMRDGPLLLDGAMGTVLHGHGFAIDQCFDVITLEDPDLVAEIHRGYIEAGSDIIETNTFGANHFKLAQHGLEDQVHNLNQAAVSLARRVITESQKSILLAGSVGPLGVRLAPLGRVKEKQAQSAFSEQIAALVSSPIDAPLSQGVDLIILETISDLKEMEVAVKAVRAMAPDIATIGMMTFTRDDRTLLGDTPTIVAGRLVKMDLDAIGINCSSGPEQAIRLLRVIREVAADIPIVVSPNAGWPEQLDGGRVMYPATATYFAEYAREFVEAGASIVGGCCGTTFEHIAAMRLNLDTSLHRLDLPPHIEQYLSTSTSSDGPMATDRPTRLNQALQEGHFITTVEMSPPRGIGAKRLLEGARILKEAGATFIDVADSPLARMRMSAWAAAYLVQQEVGLEAVLHFPTRGRNLLRIQGDLLAAHALGIRNLFIVMGDPTQIGDYPEAMDNYDIVPSGLIRLIKKRLNVGVDQAGQTIDEPTAFTVGCALNLEPPNPDRELKLLRKKINNGADFALTQPVFNTANARSFIDRCIVTFGPAMLPIIAGVQPLFSSGNAEFLHNEVPGIQIPGIIRRRIASAKDEQQEGVLIAQETLEDLRPYIDGAYLIPVFNRYDLVANVMDILVENV